MKAKEVLLLLLIILIGVGFHYLDRIKTGIEDWDFDLKFRGEPYLFEENFHENPAEILRIINSHGSLQVEGAETDRIQIVMEKRVWSKNEEEAREIAEKIKPLMTVEGQQLVLTTNRDSFRRKNFATGFRLKVPRTTALIIRNSYGPVRISGAKEVDLENPGGKVEIIEISGAVRVKNSHEKVSIIDAGGECQLETKHSSALLSRIGGPVRIDCAHETLELFDLKNSLNIQSRHTRIKALRISGPLEIKGSYELISLVETGPAVVRGHHSPVEITRLKGKLDLETSYEKIKISEVEGDLMVTAKSSRIEIVNASGGNFNIETTYEPVILENFSGQLQLISKHGDIRLIPSSLDFPIFARTEYGDITFFWPENQTARFQAFTRGGSISWKLPLSPDENTSNGTAVLKAFSSALDRPEIKLETSYGEIKILKKE